MAKNECHSMSTLLNYRVAKQLTFNVNKRSREEFGEDGNDKCAEGGYNRQKINQKNELKTDGQDL